ALLSKKTPRHTTPRQATSLASTGKQDSPPWPRGGANSPPQTRGRPDVPAFLPSLGCTGAQTGMKPLAALLGNVAVGDQLQGFAGKREGFGHEPGTHRPLPSALPFQLGRLLLESLAQILVISQGARVPPGRAAGSRPPHQVLGEHAGQEEA